MYITFCTCILKWTIINGCRWKIFRKLRKNTIVLHKKLKSVSLKSALFPKIITHINFLMNTIEYLTNYAFLELGCKVLEPEWRS